MRVDVLKSFFLFVFCVFTYNSMNAEVVAGLDSREKKIDTGYSYNGDIEFWNNPSEKEFSIYFNDNKIVHYIIFQETSFDRDLVDTSYNLTLYFQGILLENNATHEQYFLGIDNAESRILLIKQQKNGLEVERSDFSAAGLIHNYGPEEGYKPLSDVRHEFFSLLEYLDDNFGPDATCTSGGPGLFGCSTAGSYVCTVICKLGYYACCKDLKAMEFEAKSCLCVKTE